MRKQYDSPSQDIINPKSFEQTKTFEILALFTDRLADSYDRETAHDIRSHTYFEIQQRIVERLVNETDILEILEDIIPLETFIWLEMGQLPKKGNLDGYQQFSREFFIKNPLLFKFIKSSRGYYFPHFNLTLISKEADAYIPEEGLAKASSKGFQHYGEILLHERVHKEQISLTGLRQKLNAVLTGVTLMSVPVTMIAEISTPRELFVFFLFLYTLQITKLIGKIRPKASIPDEVQAYIMSYALSGNESLDESVMKIMVKDYGVKKFENRILSSLYNIKALLALGVSTSIIGQLVSKSIWKRQSKSYPALSKFLKRIMEERGLNEDDLDELIQEFDQKRDLRVAKIKSIVAETVEEVIKTAQAHYLNTST